jgi:endonuclease/exonuclease/phosphatase (EEP) superfamily protein YafD
VTSKKYTDGFLEVIFRLIGEAATVVCAFSLLGFGAGLLLPLDLFNHFRLQYSVCLALSVVFLTLGRKFKLAAICAGVMLFNVALIAPLYVPRDHGVAGKKIAILDLNLWERNKDRQSVLDCIAKNKADVITFQELTPEWLTQLSDVLKEYPYRAVQTEKGAFGIGIFSRLPLAKTPISKDNLAHSHAIVATVTVGGHPLTIVNVHTLPPIFLGAADRDMKIMDELATICQQGEHNAVVIGDFNSSPWSVIFNHLLQTASLEDSEVGFGFQPTWPTTVPLLEIPIDHCLVTNGISVDKRRVLSSVNSDHFPLYLELSISD